MNKESTSLRMQRVTGKQYPLDITNSLHSQANYSNYMHKICINVKSVFQQAALIVLSGLQEKKSGEGRRDHRRKGEWKEEINK